MKHSLVLVLVATVAASAATGSVEARLAQMFSHHPEADANGDGRLTEAEAMGYVVELAEARKNRGPAGGFPEMLDAFEQRSFRGFGYRLMPPLELDSGKRYPLVVSLHGGGGIGDDNVSQLRWWNGVMSRAGWRRSYPAFVVAPQAIPGANWGERTEVRGIKNIYIKNMIPVVFDLIESLRTEYPIDESRVYVLGSSMGGSGTWNILRARPEFFAAAIPVCPGRPPDDVTNLTRVPVWTFHGSADQLVPVENSRRVFERLKAAGGSIKYTELRGIRHNSWIQAFAYKGDDPDRGFVTAVSNDRVDRTSQVWEWLFRQRRDDRP